MARLVVEVGLGELRRGHAVVAGLELQLLHELLDLLPHDGAVRQPEREALADLVVDVEEIELAAELLVVALERFLVRLDVRLELVLRLEGPGVDARHHRVVGVAAPIGARDRAQLERALGESAGVVDVRPVAHVEEGAVRVEGEPVEALLLEELHRVLALVGLAHLLEPGQRFGPRQLFALERLPLLDDLLHPLLDARGSPPP